MNLRKLFFLVAMIMTTVMAGCSRDDDDVSRTARQVEINRSVLEKYGKSLEQLPVQKLVIISPHNVDIEKEYASAFSLYHAEKYGERVSMEWRDVGGGSSAILHYLQNVYAGSESSGLDIVWGGGEYNFQIMAREGILQKLDLADDALENIPSHLGGIKMVDRDGLWCGSAVSGFGFLFNKALLDRLKLTYPEKWEDLGASNFFDLVGLADPTQSGSAAASYEMIVQSGHDWPAGWAKLLSILGNAKKFYAGAGDAAEAIPSGEVAVATCIDFYGLNRVAKYPDTLVYVSPQGQTSFNPDPIAVLKNPPNPRVAQRMVDFVLSLPGQALWALPAGHPDGPEQFSLGRQPIRKDVYDLYGGQLSPMIVNPYAAEQTMTVDQELWAASFGLLRHLVYAAAVKNLDSLKSAQKKLIQIPNEDWRLVEFNRLPDNIATLDRVKETDRLLKDNRQRDIIVTDWIAYFRDKYVRVAQ